MRKYSTDERVLSKELVWGHGNGLGTLRKPSPSFDRHCSGTRMEKRGRGSTRETK